MNATYLSVLCAPGRHAGPPLSFIGDRAGDELINGKLIAGGEQVGQVVDGIVSFVGEPVNWPPEEIDRLRAAGQIERNWRNETSHAADTPARGGFCDTLAAVDGIILEAAAGPGGGNMPPVLSRNPSARIIANDISLAVLQLWQEFLRARRLGPNMCLAAFDAREIPLRSESIGAVSSQGGLSEIGGTRVFEEVTRILRPGGLVLSNEMIVDPGDWNQMPSERRASWQEQSPGLTLGVAGLLSEAGLDIESRELLPGRALDPGEGGLPKEAAAYGVTLHVVYEYVKARKR
jgi:SAM-dependent methyltransferase